MMLGTKPDKLAFLLRDAVKHAIAPVTVSADRAKCQEVVHYATEEGFDIRKLVPAPINTAGDAGPYITMGMCYTSDPEAGESDVTIHRLCLPSKDELSIWITPGARNIGDFYQKADSAGRPLPVSISIGVDPAISISSSLNHRQHRGGLMS
jgi:4-hydroxy-3-polyprenylbenzoate decarboxylase